jgi:hypothetical protein
METVGNLQSILSKCDSYREGDTSTMQDAPIRLITIAISYGPKKTHEKNGAT